MATITFSRQYASGGDEIAARVAVLLGYAILDKTTMARLAGEIGLAEGQIVDFSETEHHARNFLNRLFGLPVTVGETRTWTEDIRGVRTPEVTKLSDKNAINMVRGVIEAAYKHGNIVIVGRGGQAILKGRPGVLHVRVEAPLEHRVQRVCQQSEVEALRAEWIIDDKDRAAVDYVKHFYGIDPADPEHYHLMVNTGLLDVETAARVIMLAAQQMQPVPPPPPLPRLEPALIFS